MPSKEMTVNLYAVNPKNKKNPTQKSCYIKKHDYLYLRGDFFYYRRRIPKKYMSYDGTSEIRLSLLTDSFREAKKKALLITARLEQSFQEQKMINADELRKMKELADTFNSYVAHFKRFEEHPSVLTIHKWLNDHGNEYTLSQVAGDIYSLHSPDSVPDFLDADLNSLLSKENSIQLTYSEISQRIVGYFRFLLDTDAIDSRSRCLAENKELDQPLSGIKTAKELGITIESRYSSILDFHKAMINSPPLLCLYSPEVLEKMIKLNVFRAEELTYENYLAITNSFCKVTVEFCQILQARLRKNYSQEKSFFSTEYIPYTNAPLDSVNSNTFQQKESSTDQTKLLSDFLENYLQTKVDDGKKSPRYIPSLKKQLEFFIRVIGDKPINTYIRQDFRSFRETLKKLPPNFSKLKQFEGKTIEEIIEIPHEKTLTVATINSYIVDISAFFSWLVTEGFLDKNIATNLTLKEEGKVIDSRSAFTIEDIHLLFKSEEFNSLKNSSKPSRYWAPWIALYTGMRIEEICQLHCADIYEMDGIWVIDIHLNRDKNNENTKNLKTVNAIRVIPIHNHLKELGFLDYLEEVKSKHVRLFPELKPSGVRLQYGKMVGKDFGLLVRKLGIEGKKSFHSLRHSFSDFYKKKLLHNTIFEQVFGHGHKKLATSRYGDVFTPKDCYDKLISLLDYEF